jgi:hypothetical protein
MVLRAGVEGVKGQTGALRELCGFAGLRGRGGSGDSLVALAIRNFENICNGFRLPGFSLLSVNAYEYTERISSSLEMGVRRLAKHCVVVAATYSF